MKLNLNEIEQTFELLTYNEQRNAIGGTGIIISDQDLQLMFNYNSSTTNPSAGGLGGFNSGAGVEFSKIIRQIGATYLGGEVLSELYSKIKANPTMQIEVSNITPATGGAQYVGGTGPLANTLEIGALMALDTSKSSTDGTYFSILSHELYHAYQELQLNNPVNDNGGPVTGELDAFIFEGLVTEAYDRDGNTTSSSYYNNQIGQIYNATNNTQFQAAWSNIMSGASFTSADYNELITDFKTSDFNEQHSYDAMTTPTITDAQLSSNAIHYLWQNFYVAAFTPSGSGNPSGTDSGSGGTSDWYINDPSTAPSTSTPNDGSQLPCPSW